MMSAEPNDWKVEEAVEFFKGWLLFPQKAIRGNTGLPITDSAGQKSVAGVTNLLNRFRLKPRFSKRRCRAMTLMEVLVILAVIAALAFLFLPWSESPARPRAPRINCINNLKQDALAFKLWANDYDGKYPMEVSVTNKGAMGLAEAGNVAAVFEVMSNELTTPKILFCPADKSHRVALNFANGFGNQNISYFVGLDASEEKPNSILSGDDNFQIDDAPVKAGVLQFPTNAPVTWTKERHVNCGNIGLADGSVQQATQLGLSAAIINSGSATNRWAIP